MPYHQDFQQQVLVLLAKLKAKKEALQKTFETQLADVDREIESVSTTLRLLREPAISEVTAREYIPSIEKNAIIAELSGKTAREALAAIAKGNGGIVRILDAKPLLLSAGVIKKPKYAWGAIYTTLTRSGQFEKVPNQPGTFRLIENQAQSTFPVAS